MFGGLDEEMAKKNVKLGSGGRARSGFDMKINWDDFSHRSLIAKAVARNLESSTGTGETVWDGGPEKVAEEILRLTEWAGKLSPEAMLRAIA